MSESEIGVSVVKVGAANTRVCNLDEDIVGPELSSDSLANGDLALGSAIGIKGNLSAHFGYGDAMCGVCVKEGGLLRRFGSSDD